jgi:hypothetical protein
MIFLRNWKNGTMKYWGTGIVEGIENDKNMGLKK